jgi:hypothetical protein
MCSSSKPNMQAPKAKENPQVVADRNAQKRIMAAQAEDRGTLLGVNLGR